MQSKSSLVAFADRAALTTKITELIATQLQASLGATGKARFAVSGGSTPADVYRALSALDLPWDKIHIDMVDERFVPPTHEASNESFVHRTLLKDYAAAAAFDGLWREGLNLDEAAQAASDRHASVDGDLDVVVLGMGGDGHTASWFPHADGLSQALDNGAPSFCAVTAQQSEVTGAHTQRLTMSLPLVASAKLIILLIAGDEKRNALNAALADGPIADAPVRAILRARPDLWICWAP